MKDRWIESTLGEAYDVRDGTHDSPKYQEEGYALITSKNLKNSSITYDRIKFISEYDYININKRSEVNVGDILFAMIGTIGNPVVVKNKPDFAIKNVALFKVPNEQDSDFLKYYLESSYVKEKMQREAKGTTQKFVGLGYLRTFPISLPPLSEQKRIVAILDEAFAGIDTAIANTEKNLANARELFESFLSLVFNKQSEGWEERKLGDICSITSKLVDPRDNRFIDLKHVGAGNIVSFTGDLIQVQTARDEGLISGKFIFDEHMVLYSKIRPYLMKVARPNFIGLCSADIYPLKPLANLLDRDFLYYLLLHNKFTKYAIAGSDRAGMPKVNREHLFQYSVALPEVFEQKKITEQLDVIAIESHKIEIIYKQKLNSLKELKQSLLQKAFSGKLTAKPDKLIDENVA